MIYKFNVMICVRSEGRNLDMQSIVEFGSKINTRLVGVFLKKQVLYTLILRQVVMWKGLIN